MNLTIFAYALTLIFITLKLTGYIQWSWWAVMSPLLVSWALIIPIIFLLFIFRKHLVVKNRKRAGGSK